ncbi:MAG: hypothetical protein AAGH68_03050 [Pseudomonadota bacterium]
MTCESLAVERLAQPEPVIRPLTYIEFVKLADAGHPHRLVLYTAKPAWLMCAGISDGELGVLFSSMDRTARHPREFFSFKAIRSIYERFATPLREVCLPFYLDKDYPYDPERRAELETYLM